MGIIELIMIIGVIIICIIVEFVKKNQRKGRTGVPNRPNIPPQTPGYQTRAGTQAGTSNNSYRTGQAGTSNNSYRTGQNSSSSVSQEELKRRLMEKYKGRTNKQSTGTQQRTSSGGNSSYVPDKRSAILERAVANVAEDFEGRPSRQTLAASQEQSAVPVNRSSATEQQASGVIYQSFGMGQKPSGVIYQSSRMGQKPSREGRTGSDLVYGGQTGTTAEQLVQEADALAEIDLYNIFAIPQMQQESELMKTVSDIMAKGVDTQLPYQRDFVAEGLDMISNMTV